MNITEMKEKLDALEKENSNLKALEKSASEKTTALASENETLKAEINTIKEANKKLHADASDALKKAEAAEAESVRISKEHAAEFAKLKVDAVQIDEKKPEAKGRGRVVNAIREQLKCD